MDFLRSRYILVSFLLGFGLPALAGKGAGTPVMVSAKPLAMIYVALRPQHPVDVLLPGDRDMHEYSLAVKDIRHLQSANTFFWLGAKSEPFLLPLKQRFSAQQHWITVAENTSHGWLDKKQLPSLVNAMANALIQASPAEKEAINTHRETLITTINKRYAYWQQRLKPYSGKPFLLGHDAFQVFARDIGLQQGIMYRSSHDHGHVQAGMHELLELQKRIANGEITCAMEEPTVSFSKLAARYNTLRLGRVDPMANEIALSANAYAAFIDKSAQAFAACLGERQ